MENKEKASLLNRKKDLLNQIKGLNASAETDIGKAKERLSKSKTSSDEIGTSDVYSSAKEFQIQQGRFSKNNAKESRKKADSLHAEIEKINNKLGIKPTLK